MRGFVLIFTLIISNISTAQEVLIIDSITNNPVKNVNVYTTKHTGTSTDKNGVFSLTEFNKSDTIIIQHISYKVKRVLVKSINKLVLLSPKSVILTEVNLEENTRFLQASKQHVFIKTLAVVDLQSKSIADLISKSFPVSIQENQAGGGSPNFRGMEANRLLLVVDKIPLNNAIYRGGHVQSSATINPFFLQSTAVVLGPSSVMYGDGALGSAIVFTTISPKFSSNIKTNLHQQFESSSNTHLLNYKTSYGNNKIAFLSAFSIKSAGNLTMGKNRFHGYENWGKESACVTENKQLKTDYKQYDMLNKINWKINNHLLLELNSQFSTSSNINRFDKLNDMINGEGKYSDWYYGPQKRFLNSIKSAYSSNYLLFDKLDLIFAFQNINESRHHKKNNDSLLSNRYEDVKIYDLAIDFKKSFKKAEFGYGGVYRSQSVESTANLEINNNYYYNTTRYADGGSQIKDFSIYTQAFFSPHKNLEISFGSRYNNNTLYASFNDTNSYSLPFKNIETANASFANSLLLNLLINQNIKLIGSVYNGFRNPNIDDVTKVFSKNDRTVVVPNANLLPENATNFEIGFDSDIIKGANIKFMCFNTVISNAIQKRNSELNGDTMLLYDGELMRIQMNQNVELAKIQGFHFATKYTKIKNLTLSSNCMFIRGKTSEGEPFAHIPPFNLNFDLKYTIKSHMINIYMMYNGWKKNTNYDLAGVDNLEEATIDGNPAWYTLNLLYNIQLDDNILLGFGIKNIFDAHYKTFASGLSASGRNFTLSLHSEF